MVTLELWRELPPPPAGTPPLLLWYPPEEVGKHERDELINFWQPVLVFILQYLQLHVHVRQIMSAWVIWKNLYSIMDFKPLFPHRAEL